MVELMRNRWLVSTVCGKGGRKLPPGVYTHTREIKNTSASVTLSKFVQRVLESYWENRRAA